MSFKADCKADCNWDAKCEIEKVMFTIDKTGKTVLQPKFLNNGDCAVISGTFSEGLARWKMGNRYGYINKKGEVVIPARFNYTDHFSEGLAWSEINNKVGFIDKNGKIVIKPLFSHADNFKNGLARVIIENKVGYIDKTGKYIWKPTK